MEYSDVIRKIRRIANDSNGNRWTDEEIISYIDLAQRRFSISSLCLEGELNYIGDSTLNGAYKLPDDFLQFDGFLLPNGVEIDLISFANLEESFTAKCLYAETELTPLSVYLDFSSWNEIRFYPSPVTGVDIGSLKYRRLPEPGIIEIEDIDALAFFSLFRMWVKGNSKDELLNAKMYLERFNKIEREAVRSRKIEFRRVVKGRFF